MPNNACDICKAEPFGTGNCALCLAWREIAALRSGQSVMMSRADAAVRECYERTAEYANPGMVAMDSGIYRLIKSMDTLVKEIRRERNAMLRKAKK